MTDVSLLRAADLGQEQPLGFFAEPHQELARMAGTVLVRACHERGRRTGTFCGLSTPDKLVLQPWGFFTRNDDEHTLEVPDTVGELVLAHLFGPRLVPSLHEVDEDLVLVRIDHHLDTDMSCVDTVGSFTTMVYDLPSAVQRPWFPLTGREVRHTVAATTGVVAR